jgi:hypothetical protein
MIVPRQDLTQFTPVFGWGYNTNDGIVDVCVRCPNGHIASLRDHIICLDGIVKPSVKCPKCEFHESLVLENYAPA